MAFTRKRFNNIPFRRMRCVVFLVTLLIYSSSFANEVDLSLSPMCIINYGNTEQPCAYFKERSLEKLLEESWTDQAVNKTSHGSQYTNISIVYTRKSDLNSILVMIRYDKFPLPEKTWEIQAVSKEVVESPVLLTIAYAPMPEKHTSYQIRRIVNPSKLLEDPACNKSETTIECKSLKNSKLFMRKSWGNTLSLSMSSHLPRRSLAVEILSAQCNITCRGDINPCSGVEIRNMRWNNSMEELKIYNTINNSSPLYYCARISPAYHECCMIYTETIVLYPDDHRDLSVTFSHNIYLPEFFMVLSISLALLVFAMFTIRKMFGTNSYKCWPYYTLGSQRCVEDGLLNSYQEDNSPSKNSAPPSLQQPVEVLLIYPRESESMENLMSKFRYILSFYVSKVWDPFDDLEIEKVSENPSMWLENVLSRDQVKVILVENSSTVEWYETCLRGRQALHYHHLDSLFLYTVSVLHNNPYLCHNYSRLFIIRFSSSKTSTKSTNIVPCTRYEIPQNFGNLITDLVGSSGPRAKSDFQPPLKEIQELENMINE